MKQLPTKISKSESTNQIATISGQREILLELRNKANEIIDYLADRVDGEGAHPSPQIEHGDWDSEIGLAVPKDDGPLYGFVQYCTEHPELRFWQAVYAWSRAKSILVDGDDPFYWEGRRKEADA